MRIIQTFARRQVKGSRHWALTLSNGVLKRQLVVLLFRYLNSDCALAAGTMIHHPCKHWLHSTSCLCHHCLNPLYDVHLLPVLSESICCQKKRAFNMLIYHCQIQGFMACIWILYLRYFCDYRCFTYKLLYIRNIFFFSIFKETSHSCVLHFNVFCIAECAWIAFCL